MEKCNHKFQWEDDTQQAAICSDCNFRVGLPNHPLTEQEKAIGEEMLAHLEDRKSKGV